MQEPSGRIAVIAIHGVSSHKEGGCVRATADMLQRELGNRYGPAEDSRTVIEVTPIPVQAASPAPDVAPDGAMPPARNRRTEAECVRPKWLQEYRKGDHLDQTRNQTPEQAEQNAVEPDAAQPDFVPPVAVGPDFRFMEGVLKEYAEKEKEKQGADPHPVQKNLYAVLRSRLTRTDKTTHKTAVVDVHELYWDDLSRVGSGFLPVIGGLFHLIFHLPQLGLQTLEIARGRGATDQNAGAWEWLNGCAAGAAWLLTLWIPLLHLLLVGTISVVVPLALPPEGKLIAACATFPTLVAGLLAWWRWQYVRSRPEKPGVKIASWLPLILGVWVILVGIFLAVCWSGKGMDQNDRLSQVIVGQWWVLISCAVWGALEAFDARRPGAKKWAPSAGAAFFVVNLLFAIRHAATHKELVAASLDAATALYGVLMALNVLFVCLAVLVWWPLAWPPVKPEEREKVGRARTTMLVSLFAPAILFFVLTLTLWTGIKTALVGPAKPDSPIHFFPPDLANAGTADSESKPEKKPMRYDSQDRMGLLLGPCRAKVIDGCKGADAAERTAEGYIHSLLVSAATLTLPLVTVLTTFAVLALAWTVFPSAFAESRPPGRIDAVRPEVSHAMGLWLTRGARFLPFALGALGIALFLHSVGIVIEAYIAFRGVPWVDRLGPVYQATDAILGWFGGAIATSAVALAALGSRLDALGAGPVRQVVEVLFDVDQHLRARPVGKTPRARIAARYVALLRHLDERPTEEKYDAIVIVAHSLGSVITVDLLRYLLTAERRATGADAPLPFDAPVYLLTFGCPLRQLHSLRFPYLYEWARYDEGDMGKRKPFPEDAGVQVWTNIYHSGDYVGRMLWADDPKQQKPAVEANWDYQPVRQKVDHHERAYERCIGAGAHIPYWESCTPELATELDWLIQEALNNGNTTGPNETPGVAGGGNDGKGPGVPESPAVPVVEEEVGEAVAEAATPNYAMDNADEANETKGEEPLA